MKKRAGSVVVPSRVDTSVFPANDAEAITGVVGADLIAQTPEVIAWLSSIFPEKTLILVGRELLVKAYLRTSIHRKTSNSHL